MAGLDYYLNVTGSSLELAGVFFGGLALPSSKGLREGISGPLSFTLIGLSSNFQRLSTLASFGVVIVSTLAYTGVIEPIPDIYAVIAIPAIMAVLGAKLVGRWLADAKDETLRRVLELMGFGFGVGILLQLIAAATP